MFMAILSVVMHELAGHIPNTRLVVLHTAEFARASSSSRKRCPASSRHYQARLPEQGELHQHIEHETKHPARNRTLNISEMD